MTDAIVTVGSDGVIHLRRAEDTFPVGQFRTTLGTGGTGAGGTGTGDFTPEDYETLVRIARLNPNGNPITDFYVNINTGVDSIDEWDRGLSPDKPWKTIHYTVEQVRARVSSAGRAININLAPGTYVTTSVINLDMSGVTVNFRGTDADPNNTVIRNDSGANQSVIYVPRANVNISNLKLVGSTYVQPTNSRISMYSLHAQLGAVVVCTNVISESRSRSYSHFMASYGGFLEMNNEGVMGATAANVFVAYEQGHIIIQPNKVPGFKVLSSMTLYNWDSAAPAAGSGYFCNIWRQSDVQIVNAAIPVTGTFSGIKYSVTSQSRIVGSDYLPGSAGTTASGGSVV